MPLHAFIEYLKYTWKAKGRHGIHSPFVYELIEQVLLDKGKIKRAYIVTYPTLSLRYENLISRIAAYYEYETVLLLPLANEAEIPLQANLMLLDGKVWREWGSLLNKYIYLLKNTSAVIVTDIHKTREHTMEWNKLCADARIRMSIDMYGIGLLLFKPEFKEQQHFILKY